KFKIDDVANRLYLPSDQALAQKLGITPHPGGPLDSYTKVQTDFLRELAESADGEAAIRGNSEAQARVANQLASFRDTMKVALINGDLYTNRPQGWTQKDVAERNSRFASDWEGYRDAHASEINNLRALERGLAQSADGHTRKFVSLADLNNPGST